MGGSGRSAWAWRASDAGPMPEAPSGKAAAPAVALGPASHDGLGHLLRRCRRPPLVGVGGTGMNGLATLLVELGKEVSGADRGPGP